MPETEEHLRNRLAEASDPTERLDLMIELAYKTRQSDPVGARKLVSNVLRIAKARNDTHRMTRSTTILGLCEQSLANYSTALKRFKQAMTLAETLNDRTLQPDIHYGFGIAYTSSGNYHQALESLKLALKLAREEGLDRSLGYIHNGIAMVYGRLTDYTRALEHFRQSLESFEALQDSVGQAIVLNNAGTVYLALRDLNPAFESFSQSNNLAMAINDVRSQAYSLSNLGEVLHLQEKPREAEEYYIHALELSRILGDRYLEANILSSIAALQITKSDGDFEIALKFSQQAMEIAEEMGQNTLWHHMVRTGEIYYYRKEYERAIEFYNKALEGTREQGDRLTEYQILFGLSECYEAIGDVAEAFRCHKLYSILKEEVIGQQQQEMMQFRMRMEM
jgi:tetratricopeptide (TPR) repeat protein